MRDDFKSATAKVDYAALGRNTLDTFLLVSLLAVARGGIPLLAHMKAGEAKQAPIEMVQAVRSHPSTRVCTPD